MAKWNRHTDSSQNLQNYHLTPETTTPKDSWLPPDNLAQHHDVVFPFGGCYWSSPRLGLPNLSAPGLQDDLPSGFYPFSSFIFLVGLSILCKLQEGRAFVSPRKVLVRGRWSINKHRVQVAFYIRSACIFWASSMRNMEANTQVFYIKLSAKWSSMKTSTKEGPSCHLDRSICLGLALCINRQSWWQLLLKGLKS